jgi:serine/threonine-protein kinase HipA
MGEFFVYNKTYAGKCYWAEKRSRVTSIFTYDSEYISGKDNWSIDPALALVEGAQPSGGGLCGAFRDASPDRWGQTLIKHRHMRMSRETKAPLRSLNDVDYLMGVSDFTRQGDLRFSMKRGGDFEHPSKDIPKLVSLPKLLDAAHRFTLKQDDNAITFLLDAGSASLGGARPKAVVSDGENLFIAKFPHQHDRWDVMGWEWVSLSVARDAGILVPENMLTRVDGQNVLLMKRFDRESGERIPYISVMTLLGLNDGQSADYFEIAEKIRDVSVCVKDDLHELFRRIMLSLLLNNTDDHLRNHGLLGSGSGFRLSPVFDVNPNPVSGEMRVTSVFAEIEKTAALNALMENTHVFDLSPQEADTIFMQVSGAVKSLGAYAKKAGIPKSEITFMLSSLGV